MLRNRLALLILAGALAPVAFAACGGDDDDDTADTPTSAATASKTVTDGSPSPATSATTTTGPITLKNPTTTPSGLQYEDIVVGTGASPQTGFRVTVHYTGTFLDGKKFDSSVDRGQPFTFVIGAGQVIKGWDEGVATMKVGGKRNLIIPSALAYGSRGQGPIPPNTDLYFEVELISVQ
ncbi:MAG: FKBP-type peptidyl-prolyl cis-trans isomerase [Dehalococcoidia bacterium]|nr:FKBP-type peptidyl-prolyl cis-trans isomerase [Dehalococcoidia bacterium]